MDDALKEAVATEAKIPIVHLDTSITAVPLVEAQTAPATFEMTNPNSEQLAPPDSGMTTFLRLLGFLRPYRRSVVASLTFALLAMVMTVSIPWLTGQAINQIYEGDRANLKMLAGAVLLAGILRALLTVIRRLVAGRVSLGVEFDLRAKIYGHLQSLELAFFDQQQTGQLMSRATVDLQAVRFFLGYGLVFLIQALLTIGLAAIAMFLTDPLLAALSLAPVPFVIVIAFRYGRRSRPALQEVQQRVAELTAEVDENIAGVRVVKAFAAEKRQKLSFDYRVGRVFDQSMVSTRLTAFYSPFIGFLPQLGLAAVLFFGGRQVINGNLSIGAFSAFYTYLLMLIAPMRTFGMMLGLSQRATASGGRIFQILDRQPEITAEPGAGPLPAGGGRVQFENVTLRYPNASSNALESIDLDVRAGLTVALVGGTGSGKSSLVQLIPRLYDTTGGAFSSTALMFATSTRPSCAARSQSSTTTPSYFQRACATTSPTPDPMRATRRCSLRPSALRRPVSSRSCRMASPRSSASAA